MAGQGISALFGAVVSAISQLLPRSISQLLPPPPPPRQPPAADIEMAGEVHANHEPFPSFTERIKSLLAQSNLNWSKLVIAFCFGSALEIAHQSRSQSQSQLPSTLYLLLCFAISVSFSCIFVAKFVGSRFSMAAQLLELAGVLFAVTAFFLAITSPFPLSLKFTVWALYVVSLLAILISNLL
ncbi:hypothetical protein PVL29_022031 [Vitis rotundifolia]|uniref:Uncharacterized protein n=1 Tax=Vitis rotundifolia TaxID=103349 RepID=A0AA39DAC9_VITRO|nr:hypothetical protein PVL29_022031 [Vitis rotundifolia]